MCPSCMGGPISNERNTGNSTGAIILCDTVTTGKCLIGLTCGSISRLTKNRTM